MIQIIIGFVILIGYASATFYNFKYVANKSKEYKDDERWTSIEAKVTKKSNQFYRLMFCIMLLVILILQLLEVHSIAIGTVVSVIGLIGSGELLYEVFVFKNFDNQLR